MSVSSVKAVTDLLERWGAERYDEEVAQLEHALQTAALAAAAGADEPLVVAALLHDVGHLLALEHGASGVPDRDVRHEDVGAACVAPAVPHGSDGADRAARARQAVPLCRRPGVSLAAVSGIDASLEVQGGPLAADEIATFRSLPGYADAVLLRRCDDGGKVDGVEVAPLSSYRRALERVAWRDVRSR